MHVVLPVADVMVTVVLSLWHMMHRTGRFSRGTTVTPHASTNIITTDITTDTTTRSPPTVTTSSITASSITTSNAGGTPAYRSYRVARHSAAYPQGTAQALASGLGTPAAPAARTQFGQALSARTNLRRPDQHTYVGQERGPDLFACVAPDQFIAVRTDIRWLVRI